MKLQNIQNINAECEKHSIQQRFKQKGKITLQKETCGKMPFLNVLCEVMKEGERDDRKS